MKKRSKPLKTGDQRTYTSKSGAVYELRKVKDGKPKPKKSSAKKTTSSKAAKKPKAAKGAKPAKKARPAKKRSAASKAGKAGAKRKQEQLTLLVL